MGEYSDVTYKNKGDKILPFQDLIDSTNYLISVSGSSYSWIDPTSTTGEFIDNSFISDLHNALDVVYDSPRLCDGYFADLADNVDDAINANDIADLTDDGSVDSYCSVNSRDSEDSSDDTNNSFDTDDSKHSYG